MFSNAISSAVGRMYGSGSTVAARQRVQRVQPVSRLAGATAAPAPEIDRQEREHAAQRASLTDGVRQVFESASGIDTRHPGLIGGDSAADHPASAGSPSDQTPTDPQLEEAIVRFIHAVFSSLTEAEGGKVDQADIGPAFSSSRERLGAKIEALATRLKSAGSGDDMLDGVEFTVDVNSEIKLSFAEVLQALGVNPGSGNADDGQSSRSTRGDLVNLMHRLAIAMQGAPPVAEGLPTVGGLLHARA